MKKIIATLLLFATITFAVPITYDFDLIVESGTPDDVVGQTYHATLIVDPENPGGFSINGNLIEGWPYNNAYYAELVSTDLVLNDNGIEYNYAHDASWQIVTGDWLQIYSIDQNSLMSDLAAGDVLAFQAGGSYTHYAGTAIVTAVNGNGVASVPEPATASLLGIGLLAFVGLKRKKRQK